MLTALQKRFDEDMVIAGQHAFLMLLERIEALTQMHQVSFRSIESELHVLAQLPASFGPS